MLRDTAVECLPAELIVRYVDGTLADDERTSVERHADACASCRRALSDLAAGSLAPRSNIATAGEPAAPVDVAPGASIDRYLVLYRIGRGGMATVYAAYDPELDRKIALKVLHGSGGRDHARLLREARTLAQLQHPNVVAVYDVGEHGGLLFIAMELVDGQTARAWMRDRKSWRELAPVFIGAARALAAAHQKGIVHRDVKPENLLVDRNGVVRVSDFGLAMSEGIAGTPAYMAPEQFDGEAGPESDQYSFCVTLYEALTGARPTDELSIDAPRAIADAVRRGLSKKPTDRFPSMSALADALSVDSARTRRRIAIGLAAVALLGGGAFAFTRRTGPHCDITSDRWSVHRKAVHDAFAASKHVAGEQIFTAVDQAMAKYVGDWSAMSTESCERTRVTGDQSDTLLDLRTRCLDQRMRAAVALIDVLEQAKDRSIVDGAVTAVAGLPSIAGCADVDSLNAIAPLEKAKRAQVDALHGKLAIAAALQLTAQYPQASAIVEPALKAAIALDYAPVVGEAKFLAGDLLYRNGDYPASVTSLTEAVAAAARGHDDRTATKALTLLAGVVGYAQGKPDEGMALALTADAWSARAGRVDEDEAELADIRGLLHDVKGEPLKAKPFYERALALREKIYGPDHLMVALSLNNMAGVPSTLGQLEEARALHERAKKIREKILGPVSADLAVSINAIASIDEDERKLDDAERGFRKAIEIWEKALGPDHPDVATAHNNLGNLLRIKEDYAGATAELERALAIWGPDNPNSVSAIGNLAITYYAQKNYDKALATFNASIEAHKKALGAQHPTIGTSLVNRGQTLDELGRDADAAADFAEAVKIFEATVPAGDRRIAWALTIQGKHELKLHRPAVAILTKALSILQADKEARPDELAAARFALARAKWDAGDHKTALELAQKARTETKDVDVVDAWLKGKK